MVVGSLSSFFSNYALCLLHCFSEHVFWHRFVKDVGMEFGIIFDVFVDEFPVRAPTPRNLVFDDSMMDLLDFTHH